MLPHCFHGPRNTAFCGHFPLSACCISVGSLGWCHHKSAPARLASPGAWPRRLTLHEHRRRYPPRRSREPDGKGTNNANIYRRYDGRFEVGYRDSSGKQRWTRPFDKITEARRERDRILGEKAQGEHVEPNPRLRFAEAAEQWLAEQVVGLRPATQAAYENAVRMHLLPRWGPRRLDSIEVRDAARLVRELRAAGKAEWTISGITKAASRIFTFARRHMRWHGTNPIPLLENGERPKVSGTPDAASSRVRSLRRRSQRHVSRGAPSSPWPPSRAAG